MTRIAADPLPNYPIVAKGGTEPHIGCRDKSLYFAVCPRCPAAPAKPSIRAMRPPDWSTPNRPTSWTTNAPPYFATWPTISSSTTPTATFPILTWSDEPCLSVTRPPGANAAPSRGGRASPYTPHASKITQIDIGNPAWGCCRVKYKRCRSSCRCGRQSELPVLAVDGGLACWRGVVIVVAVPYYCKLSQHQILLRSVLDGRSG